MVHELLGIQSGRVDLSLVPDIRPELSVCFAVLITVEILTNVYSGNLADHDNRPIL